MRHFRLEETTKGWFVGAFEPTALRTDACEVAVKVYPAGTRGEMHYHKVATEVTLVLRGEFKLITFLGASHVWTDGDILVLEPGETTGFEALTEVVTVVVKVPGVLDDKYDV